MGLAWWSLDSADFLFLKKDFQVLLMSCHLQHPGRDLVSGVHVVEVQVMECWVQRCDL